ncbi:hypothetical protein DKW60_20175 [Leucothrix pacifica]|uniref:Uncharacterized protein n=1 Tax=Leucothrix pacifica TaxID=1247513 RepID=A0A317C9B8_9GAMM|nr:hypothetical protein DKW60_20175 [Leucothrix pacifica]
MKKGASQPPTFLTLKSGSLFYPGINRFFIFLNPCFSNITWVFLVSTNLQLLPARIIQRNSVKKL